MLERRKDGVTRGVGDAEMGKVFIVTYLSSASCLLQPEICCNNIKLFKAIFSTQLHKSSIIDQKEICLSMFTALIAQINFLKVIRKGDFEHKTL